MKFDNNAIKPVVELVLAQNLMEIEDKDLDNLIKIVHTKFTQEKFETRYEDNDDIGEDALLDLITDTVQAVVKHHAVPSELKFTNYSTQVSDELASSYLSPHDINVHRIPHPLQKEVQYNHLNDFFSSYERTDLEFNLKDYLGPNYFYASVAQNESNVTKINISDIEKRLKSVFWEIRKIIMYYRVKNSIQDDINIYYPMISIYKHIPEATQLAMHKSGKIISFALAGVDPYDIVKDIQKEKIDVIPGIYGVYDGCMLFSIPMTTMINGEEQFYRNMVIDQSHDVNFII